MKKKKALKEIAKIAELLPPERYATKIKGLNYEQAEPTMSEEMKALYDSNPEIKKEGKFSRNVFGIVNHKRRMKNLYEKGGWAAVKAYSDASFERGKKLIEAQSQEA